MCPAWTVRTAPPPLAAAAAAGGSCAAGSPQVRSQLACCWCWCCCKSLDASLHAPMLLVAPPVLPLLRHFLLRCCQSRRHSCLNPSPSSCTPPRQIMGERRPFLPADALQRGTANFGSGSRFERLGHKLLAGRPITVSFLGGSITWGRVRRGWCCVPVLCAGGGRRKLLRMTCLVCVLHCCCPAALPHCRG